MIEEGAQAPPFELPAVVDGEVTRITLDEYLGEEIIILAFYPGDFNPACHGETTDLDELDLFTMQKDVTILGISTDSVHSHRAFADAYDLHIPLLADVYGDVTEEYGVAVEDRMAGYRTRRAVVVINHKKRIEYTWVADDIEDLPNAETIRDAVESVGGDETARARYRVGHARYIEGRRAFTSAMGGFEDRDWMMAQSDFQRAYEEFADAADEFNTAVRFAEDEDAELYYDRAERKSEALWQAAEWLADSARAFASGEGVEGDSMRTDAEKPLETARNIHEPPDPDDFPPEEDPAAADDEDETSLLPTEEEEAASLDTDIDEAAVEMAVEADAGGDSPEASVAESDPLTRGTGGTGQQAQESADDGEEIDDEELEEIAAELEEQTEAARANAEATEDGAEGTDGRLDEPPDTDAGDGQSAGAPNKSETAAVDSDGTTGTGPTEQSAGTGRDSGQGSEPTHADAEDLEGDIDADDIDLDLADPTDDDEDETDEPVEDESPTDTGDHGVPDSL